MKRLAQVLLGVLQLQGRYMHNHVCLRMSGTWPLIVSLAVSRGIAQQDGQPGKSIKHVINSHCPVLLVHTWDSTMRCWIVL